MKLEIQKFADLEYDTDKLDEISQELEKASRNISKVYDSIISHLTIIRDCLDDENCRQAIDDVIRFIQNNDSVDLSTKLLGLSGIISALVTELVDSSSKFISEVSEWLSTAQTVAGGVKDAYTAKGATQGVETVKEAAHEMVDSGVKISGYTRGIVTETTNMLVSGGKMVKGVTGKSPQEIVQEGVGAIKELYAPAASIPGFSVVTDLFGKLGKGFAAFLNA